MGFDFYEAGPGRGGVLFIKYVDFTTLLSASPFLFVNTRAISDVFDLVHDRNKLDEISVGR